MKMGMKSTLIVSALALSLTGGTAMAQMPMDNNTAPQQMGGKMMQGQGGKGMKGNMMQGGGMMNGKGMMTQGGMGCMKMMGQGMMGGGMMGGGMMKNMSTENQQKFMDATKEMRKEMHMMRFEDMDAMRNPKTTLEELATMEQKMLDTRKELMKKAETFQDQKK
jgi:hypothetical protein